MQSDGNNCTMLKPRNLFLLLLLLILCLFVVVFYILILAPPNIHYECHYKVSNEVYLMPPYKKYCMLYVEGINIGMYFKCRCRVYVGVGLLVLKQVWWTFGRITCQHKVMTDLWNAICYPSAHNALRMIMVSCCCPLAENSYDSQLPHDELVNLQRTI